MINISSTKHIATKQGSKWVINGLTYSFTSNSQWPMAISFLCYRRPRDHYFFHTFPWRQTKSINPVLNSAQSKLLKISSPDHKADLSRLDFLDLRLEGWLFLRFFGDPFLDRGFYEVFIWTRQLPPPRIVGYVTDLIGFSCPLYCGPSPIGVPCKLHIERFGSSSLSFASTSLDRTSSPEIFPSSYDISSSVRDFFKFLLE